MSLRPAEWLRTCPDCGRPVSVPADRHPACQEARYRARSTFKFCARCGAINPTPDHACKEEPR